MIDDPSANPPPIRDICAAYLSLGWAPIRVYPASKTAVGAWAARVDQPADFALGDNIAVRLGAPSRGLVDVDLDTDHAVALASSILPATATFGREGKRRHWLYYATPTPEKTWRRGGVELRTTGGYTVFPGSVHESGDTIDWIDARAPLQIDPDELREAVTMLALASNLQRMFRPVRESHNAHDFCLALAGALRRVGWPLERTSELYSIAFGEHEPHRMQAVHDTYALEADATFTGWPRLAAIVGDKDTTVVKELASDAGLGFIVRISSPPRNDEGNAERLEELIRGRWHHIVGVGWLEYERTDTGGQWQARTDGPWAEVRPVCARIGEEAKQADDPDKAKALRAWAVSSGNNARVSAMFKHASVLPTIARKHTELDTDRHLLSCANGILDLRTGQLLSPSPEYLLTRSTPHAVALTPTPTPKFDRFIRQIMDSDEEMAQYLERWLALCLTGEVLYQCFALWHGKGANGKSLLLNYLHELLGQLAVVIPSSVLVGNGNEHPTHLMSLRGARLAYANETLRGAKWNESMVKQLTGGDLITARKMHQDFVEFAPTHKLVVATNERPIVRDDGESFWRRVHLVPFTVDFRDSGVTSVEIMHDLVAEAPAVLRKLGGIAAELYRTNFDLKPAPKVLAAVQEYRTGQDLIGSFLSEVCVHDAKARTRTARIYDVFKKWAVDGGELHIPSARTLHAALRDRGWRKVKTNGIEHYEGWTIARD